MTFRHVWVSLAALTFVPACSSDETIVTLNVTATDRVPAVERLQVTFTQGSRKLVRDFEPPSETSSPPEGEEPQTSIKNSFFKRLSLPDDWQEADAKVLVEAFDENGERFDPPLVDETTVGVLPNEVVAAYVQLDIPEEPPPTGGEGGAGGAGGESSSAGGGAGGAGAAGGADAGQGGAEASAGAAGSAEPSAGAGGDAASGGVGGAG
jgi:uncharacterized membrane protein YgcG